MTTREVAEKLRVHPKLVLRWIKNLNLPCYRMAKEFRFDEGEVDKWIEEHRHENTFYTKWLSNQKRKNVKE